MYLTWYVLIMNNSFIANTVYMTDMPPPYPGISGYNGYATAPPSGAMGFTQPQAPGRVEFFY